LDFEFEARSWRLLPWLGFYGALFLMVARPGAVIPDLDSKASKNGQYASNSGGSKYLRWIEPRGASSGNIGRQHGDKAERYGRDDDCGRINRLDTVQRVSM